MAEEFAVKLRRVEEANGLQSRLQEVGVALDQDRYYDGGENPLLARLFLPKGEPGCDDGEEVGPVASVHKAGERGGPEPSSRGWGAEAQSLHETRPRDGGQIQSRTDERSEQHAREGKNQQDVENAPPRCPLLQKIGT